jgi:fatty acid desaturase
MKVLRDTLQENKLFRRSIIKSFFFVLRDISFAVAVYSIFSQFESDSFLFWTIYAIIQGTVWTGLWVIAHECGHGAFSEYPIVNDTVGFILHSALLVPYFAWQKTHATHHARCNHLLDGETHVPSIRRKVERIYSSVINVIGEDAFAGLNVIFHLGLGWPLYLFLHFTGSRRSPVTKERYTSTPNHFDPRDVNELFSRKLATKNTIGSAGVLFMICTLGYYSVVFGFTSLLRLYVGPYLIVNAWLVLYTRLHHTSTAVPHYGEDEWTWLKGALSTIDRPYPWIVDELHHHIGTTHVCHHLFHEIPHYNAVKATKLIKEHFGDQYIHDPTPIHKALWEVGRDCQFVDDVTGVQYYKKVILNTTQNG